VGARGADAPREWNDIAAARGEEAAGLRPEGEPFDMKYFRTKAPQIVPGKGYATMHYECDDALTVVRMINHIPEASEVTKYPNPIVKRLIQPDKLEETDGKEFLGLWEK